MFITPSFKKSLIVEQFQGNYLKVAPNSFLLKLMVTFRFHLQPQYNHEFFRINFASFHCTERYELNKLTSLPMCGFIAQLVEHRTGITEVMGSNPVEALIFFRLLLSSCLNWKNYCDGHSSVSSTATVQI